MHYKEEYINIDNKTKIRAQINKNTDRINVIFIHGLGERLEHYHFLYDKFESSNIALSMMELRGHGLSGGEPKYIKKFDDYVEDLQQLIESHFKDKEIFFFGHSTGALTEALFCQIHENIYPIKGLIFTSPLFKVNIGLPEKIFILIMSKIYPKLVIKAKEENFYKLTHDESMAKLILEESQRTVMGTKVAFIRAFCKARKKLLRNCKKITHIKTFVYLADQDCILDVQTIEKEIKFHYKESKKLHLQMLKDCYHSILLESKKNEYIDDIINWIHKNS